jgi:uncharacterized protein (DUF2141 family)
MPCFRTTLAAALALGLLASASASAETCAWTPSANKLEIVVEGVKSDKGLMTASVYSDDKSQFLVKNGAVHVWSEPAAAPETHLCIWLKAPGTYALVVYHDANSNQKWDHSLLGSIEGIGFSNNPHLFLSAPPLEKVTFEVKGAVTTLHVRLTYP